MVASPAMAKITGSSWLPVVVVVMVQVAFGVMNVLAKRVLDEGMSIFVLITYRLLIAAVLIGPIAYCVERHKRPKLTTSIFLLFFFSGLLGMTGTLYFFFYGLSHTSATFGCAFVNMTPVLTFLLSLPFRMERLNIKSKAGLAKLLGTVLCVGGAMVLTLYKGRVLTPPTSGTLPQPSQKLAADELQKQWILGSLSLIAGSVAWASWFVMQATISKAYPALYSNNAIVTLLSALQSAAFTLVLDRDPSIWALRGTLQVVTVVYGGAVTSCLGYILMAWCVKKRGPVFTAAFTPLIQVSVAIIEVLFLHEQLHLGSVLGSVVIIMGLYMLLCGKSEENKCITEKQRQAADDNPALQLA